VRDLIELIGAKLGRSPIVDYRPAAMGDVEVTRACIEKARRILDYWPSTRLSDGLAKYIAWIDCGREKESALVDLAAAK